MARRSALSLIAVLVSLACAVPAHAQAPPPKFKSFAQKPSPKGPLLVPGQAMAAARADLLWATVNICDTFDSPDAMGVRGSMPGNGRRGQRMYMRFAAQWWSGMRQQWLDVPRGKSPWQYAGPARFRSREMGWTFDFATPPYGRAYVLRGLVEYQWRVLRRPKGVRKATWKVAKSKELYTKTGVKGVDGGDPKGTSKAMCAIANVG